MPILLEDLIKQLPADTEEKVRKAKDRFNNRVRDETRFYFRRRTDLNDHRDEIITVPTSVQAGLPEALLPRMHELREGLAQYSPKVSAGVSKMKRPARFERMRRCC